MTQKSNQIGILFVLILAATLVGCQSTEQISTPTIDSPTVSSESQMSFYAAALASCRARNPEDEKYCTCYAKVMDKVTPSDLKMRSFDPDKSTSATRQMSKVMRDNDEALDVCEQFKTLPDSASDELLTDYAADVVRRNKGRLLSPEKLSEMRMPRDGKNYDLVFLRVTDDMKTGAHYRLSRIRGRRLYYDYIFSDGRVDQEKYAWDKGVAYIKITQGDNITYRIRDALDHCRFTLGKCSGPASRNRTQHFLTEYKDGVWYYYYSRFGNKIVDMVIYDMYGLPLYQKHHIFGRNKHIESVRKQ